MKIVNWQAALSDYVAAAHTMPFSYDRAMGLDCCTFTFGAIYAQVAIDVGYPFRGRYSTRKEALRLMKHLCGKPSLPAALAYVMREAGFTPVLPLFAQRGDAVLVPQRGGDFFGILDLNGQDVISVGERGLRRVPISRDCTAWRIR